MELHFDVDGEEMVKAGEASSSVKKILKQLGISADIIRRTSIAMYEAEINMVIHADGGIIDVEILHNKIQIIMRDTGPGIEDIDLAMKEGYSTAGDNIRQLGFGAGMGLPNIKRFADELKITSVVGVGTNVEIVVNL